MLLLWMRRAGLRAACAQPGPWLPGASLWLAAAALGAWALGVEADVALFLAAGLALLATGLVLGGRRACRLLALPVAVLWFSAPWPAVLVHHLVAPLQLFTAQLAEGLLDVLGVPAVATADVVRTPEKTFRVVEACSGLLSLRALTVTALVYKGLLPRTRLDTLLLVGAAPPVALLANGIRVVSLVLNPSAEEPGVHEMQGLAVFAGGALLLAGIDRVLASAIPAAPPARRARTPEPLPRARLLALAALAPGLLLAGAAWPSRMAPEPGSEPEPAGALGALAQAFPGWHSAPAELDRNALGSLSWSDAIALELRRGPEQIELFVAGDSRRRGELQLFSPKTAWPGSGWLLVDSRWDEGGPAGARARWLRFRAEGRELAVLHWYEGVGTLGGELLRATLGLDRCRRTRRPPARVVRIATPAGPDSEARLRQAAHALRSALPPLGGSGATAG